MAIGMRALGKRAANISRGVAAISIPHPSKGGMLDLFRPTKAPKIAPGVTPRQVYADAEGSHWLLKYEGDGVKPIMLQREAAAHDMARLVGEPISDSTLTDVGQRVGFLQKMYDDSVPLSDIYGPEGRMRGVSKMSTQDAKDILRSHVFDTAIGNSDLTTRNYLKTPQGVKAIDKGFAFKYVPEDVIGPEGTLPHEVMKHLGSGMIKGADEIIESALSYADEISSADINSYKAVLSKAIEPGSPKFDEALAVKRNLRQIYEQKLSTMGLYSRRPSTGRMGALNSGSSGARASKVWTG